MALLFLLADFSLNLQENPKQIKHLQQHEAELQSRRIMVQCFFSANSNMNVAVAAYKRQVRAGVALHYARCEREMRYNLCKWVQTSSVQNRPHSKKQQELPDEVVRQFAYKLAMGYAHHCFLEKNGQLTEAWECHSIVQY